MAFWQEFQWNPDRDVKLKCLSPIHTFIHSLLTELWYMLQNFHRQTCMQEMNCSLFKLASPSKFGITAPCIKGSHRSADVLEWFWAHHSLKKSVSSLTWRIFILIWLLWVGIYWEIYHTQPRNQRRKKGENSEYGALSVKPESPSGSGRKSNLGEKTCCKHIKNLIVN